MSWSSGTNTIKEGDESKSLTLQMLEVKKQGGGTEYFVRKNDVKLGTKSVTQNGTYTAAADNKYGFSQFSVNVSGGNGSADSHGKPTGGDIKPGGAGSAVVGTDPETGNEVVIGVDEDENLVKTPLPSSIVLVTNPTKMSYTEGESIDLSGAVVAAKNGDGTTWTNADYPNGHVSCTPEPGTAHLTGIDTSPFSQPIISESGTVSLYSTRYGVTYYFTVRNGVNVITRAGGQFSTIGASEHNNAVWSYTASDGTGESQNVSSEYTYGGKTVYYTVRDFNKDFGANSTIDCAANEGLLTNELLPKLAWSAIYGGTSSHSDISLNWARPGDGKVLSTTMQVSVTTESSESGSHNTESSSGTEGSGGGGTF